MTTYICKCGQRVQKSGSADNTGNRLEGYGPGHECYGCPYAMPWGGNKWDEAAKRFVQDIKGYECRTSRTLSYDSHFIGSTKDKCTCSVVSLDFDFLKQISAWVKDTFPLGELTGGFSQDEIRPTDYSHNGRYCCTFVCASNKKGIAAKAALFARFFDPDGSRKDMTPQQEMEKVLTDIKNSRALVKEKSSSDAPAACICSTCTCGGCKEECFGNCRSCGHPVQECNSYQTEGEKHLTPAHSEDVAEPFGNIPAAPSFDFGADDQTNALLLQDAQTFITGNMARIMAAKHAHDLTANHYKGSWGKWCAAVGISRDTGDRMVSVAAQCGNIEIEGKSILDVRPLKLLYAAAKPSTPQKVKEDIFSGDISTYKEYQDVMAQLKAEKERADTAEAERDKARADQLSTAKDCNRLGLKAEQEKARADKAEGERDEWKAEAEAARKQPIVAVVDKDEVARQVDVLTAEAKAQARSQVEDAQRRANEAEAKYQKLQQDADGFLAPEQACEQQAHFIADSMRSMYLNWFGQACATGTPLTQMGAPLYALCGEIMSSLEDDTAINPTAAGSVEDAEREALFE